MLRGTARETIARDGELDQIQDVLARVRSGHCAGVLVCGPTGIGKTRLVQEGVRRFLADDDLLLVGHCVDLYGEEMPYGAIADALRTLVRQRGLPSARALLGPSASLLAPLAPSLASEVDGAERGQIFDGFAAALAHASRSGVVWLWLEDVQWADRGTRRMLSYLLRTGEEQRLFVVVTARTESKRATSKFDELLGELMRLQHVHRLDLAPLPRRGVGELLRQLAGAVTPERVERIAALSGGLPFYVELLAAEQLGAGGGLPASVRGLVLTELRGLGADARTVVEAASVHDGRLPHQGLLFVVDTAADVTSGVREAVAAGVLVSEPGGDGYRFRHALIREAVAAELLPDERSRWHASWARYLEDQDASHGDPLSRIAAAHHWASADDPTRAFTAALTGAELANSLVSAAEENRLLLRALELWPRVPDAAALAGVDYDSFLRWVIVAHSAEENASAIAHIIKNEQRKSDGDPVRGLFLHIFDPTLDHERVVDAEAAHQLLTAPLENPWLPRTAAEVSFEIEDQDPALAQAVADHAVASGRHLRELTGSPRGDRAQQLRYRSLSPEVDLLFAEHAQAERWFAAGDIEATERFYLELAPRLQAVSTQIQSEGDAGLARSRLAAGKYRDALADAVRGLGRIRQPDHAAVLFAELTELAAEAHAALGQWHDARAHLDGCLEAIDDDSLTAPVAALAGLLASWTGDVATAVALAAHAPAERVYQGPLTISTRPRWLAAELAARRHDLPATRSALAPLWSMPHPEIVSEQLWQPLLFAVRTEVDSVCGRPGRAPEASRRHLDACREVAAKMHRDSDVGVAWKLHLEAELGRLDDRSNPGPWQAALDAWTQIGHRPQAAHARIGLAVALISSPRTRDAATALAAAHAAAHRLGAATLRADVEALARRARIPLTGTVTIPDRSNGRHTAIAPEGLTPRELEVLVLIARGHGNAQIAATLFISPKTASVHVSRILTKLQVSSRSEAAAVAHHLGLLEPL